MAGIMKVTLATEKNGSDSLRINKSDRNIKAHVSLLNFRDKETRQYIQLCDSLDITGYGETPEKAREMVLFSISNYFDYLIDLPAKQIEVELRNLGWKHSLLHTKQYSKVFVDISGELQNFNAVDDKVEREILETA